jgi:hypothetical protein
MKANELRIGNIVNISEDWYRRNPHLSKTPKQIIVDSINYDGLIGTSIYFANGYEIEDDLEPIPLTEERLLKFGFDLIKSGCESPSDWYFRHNNLTGSIDNLTWKYTHQHGLKLKYVHQLQNLYFALTGEELKLV